MEFKKGDRIKFVEGAYAGLYGIIVDNVYGWNVDVKLEGINPIKVCAFLPDIIKVEHIKEVHNV